MKPWPAVEATSSLRPGSWTNTSTISWFSSRSTISRTGSPWPRPPGSWLASSVKNLPLVANTSSLSVVVGPDGALEAVALLELELGGILHVPLHGADPALLGQDHGDRLLLDHRLHRGRPRSSGASARTVRRRPSVGLLGVALLGRRGSRRRSAPTADRPTSAAASTRASPWRAGRARRGSPSPRAWTATRRRRFRIASACTSVSLNLAISLALGSSSKRMMRITSSRLRIGDQIAVEHLEAVLDLLQADTRSGAPAPRRGARATASGHRAATARWGSGRPTARSC